MYSTPLSDEVWLEWWKRVYAIYEQNTARLDMDKFRIAANDPGWYQVRNALADANLAEREMEILEEARKTLENKIRPMVYQLGFLEGEEEG